MCHVAGAALVVGTAVAATVAGIISVPRAVVLDVLGAALCAAIVWNLITLRLGLPCSSGHCLVGARSLGGPGSGRDQRRGLGWSARDPAGRVPRSLAWLVTTSAILVPLAWAGIDSLGGRSEGLGRHRGSIRRGEIATTAALAFVHGSNDAQKTMGLLALALVATGHLTRFAVPLWVVLASAGALTVGTSLSGWRVVRTLGRGIFRLRSLEGLVSQASASVIVLAGSLARRPHHTSDVVAPAVVGVGAGNTRRHVRWRVVGNMGSRGW